MSEEDVEAFMKGFRKQQKRQNRKRKNKTNEIRLRLKVLRARDPAADEKRGLEISPSPRVTHHVMKKQITSLPYLGQIINVREQTHRFRSYIGSNDATTHLSPALRSWQNNAITPCPCFVHIDSANSELSSLRMCLRNESRVNIILAI